MIFIHSSANEQLYESAVVLRTNIGTFSQQEVHIVLLKGSHLEVLQDSETSVSTDSLLPRTGTNTSFVWDTFGRIWDMQVSSCRSHIRCVFDY